MTTFKKADRPHGYTDEHAEYLEALRESGETNMYGAAPYLQRRFSLDKNIARTYTSYWMESYGKEVE